MRKNKRIISITVIIIFTLTMFSINVYAGSGSSKLQSTEHESEQSSSTDGMDDILELKGSCGENVRYLFNSETGKLTISGTGTWHKVNWLSGLGKLVKSVIIEEEVNNIPFGAFVGYTNLTSVIIPNSVTKIDSFAFGGCKSLKEITIPGSVAWIGDKAFCLGSTLGTSGRKDFLDSVTYLGNIPPDHPNFTLSMFGIGPCCTIIHVPYNYKECSDFGRYSVSRGSKPTDYESKRSSSTNDVFELKGSCGQNVIYLFNSETGKLTISGTGTWRRINWDSFKEQIKSIIIDEGVNNISCAAFMGYTNLTSVTIPNSVTQIGSCAFFGCESLKEIVIPGSVAWIGIHAFYWCCNLDSVTYLGNTPPNYPNGSNYGCHLGGIVYTSKDSYNFLGCHHFSAINVPYNYKGTTFYGCEVRKGSA